MSGPFRFALALGTVLLLGTLPSPAQETCASYKVRRGDTLRTIAIRSMKTADYAALFAANRKLLRSPDALEVGQVIRIPCPDGRPPGAPESAAAPQPAARLPALPAPVPRTTGAGELRFITASDLAPFADTALPGGGLIPELIARVMETALPDQPWRIDTVRDPVAQLELLLPLGTFDIGLPWIRPECPAAIDAPMIQQRLCESYVFSDPLYELETVVHVAARSPLVSGRGLPGSVCLPEGYLGLPPGEDGLLPAATVLERAESVAACAELVRKGGVDAMRSNPGMVTGELPGLAALPRLATRHALVMVAARSNPAAVERLAAVGTALGQTLGQDEWAALATGEIAAWRNRAGVRTN